MKMRGSVFGIGTDVGGSVRIPAMCNGIIGFKPSGGRVSSAGQQTGQPPAAGKVGLESVVGVIAREWDDVDLFLESVEAARLWEIDQEVIPGKWWSECDDFQPSTRKEKNPVIGVIWRDGNTEPLPPVRRALEEVVKKLKSNNISVITVPAPKFKNCQSLTNKFFSAGGNTHLFSLLSRTQEPLIPWLASRLKPKDSVSLDHWRDLQAQRIQLQKDFLTYWKTPSGEEIDAIICPVAPHPVPPIDAWNTMSYTSSFVLLDYPAASLPVRNVEREDLEAEMEGEVLGPWDKINRELCKYRLRMDSFILFSPASYPAEISPGDKKTINRQAYLGTPLAVQVVASRLQERRLFEACKIIEDAIKSPSKRAKL